MNILAFTLIVWAGALLAGFLGALTGLGGGVVIVPLLALGISRLLSLAPALAAGVMLVGTAAGAPFLIKLTQLSNFRSAAFRSRSAFEAYFG